MNQSAVPDRYSAIAHMELRLDGKSYRVGQVAPEFIVFNPPAEIPPCEATLVIEVEGRVTQRSIRLPAGSKLTDVRVPISRD